MSTQPDPLNTLRDATRGKQLITYANNSGACQSLADASSIVFRPSPSSSNTISFPKDTPTRILKPDRDPRDITPQSDPNAFFRLDAVLLAWLLRNASVGEYMQRVRESKLLGAFVSNTDRKGLAEWLDGKTATYKGVVPLESDSTTPPGTPPTQSNALPKAGGLAPTTVSPSKRRLPADAADVEVVKKIKANEIELSDRTTVLRGTKPNDFSNVRTMFAERIKKLKEASKSGAPPGQPVTQKIDPKLQARKAKNMLPIIMISSSPSSLVTMYNVRKFLQEATFEDPTEARLLAQAEGITRPEDVIPIYRTHTHIDPSGQERRTQSRYYVVDGVDALMKFGSDAWDRVVCVLTTGQAWQFKPYKWTEPMTLFHHVKGFYVSWANDPPNHKIANWNVSELKIDPHRRHVDKSLVANFWKTLDAWTLANKPWLVKS
ncbi:CDC73 [Sanghuangporus sanghuang]